MPTHTFSQNFARPGETLSSQLSVTADGEVALDPNTPTGIPASSTAYEVDMAITVAKLKSVYLLADQNLSIKVNTSGGQAITLVAAQANQWTLVGNGGTSPLGSADVTKLLVDNAAAVAAKLQIRILYDSTPV